jgi:hypothetical protein
MPGAPSSSCEQPIAATAPPGDRTKRRVAVAKRVSTRHTGKYARHHPAQTKCAYRPCALRVLHRPGGGARATNMEPVRRVRARRARTLLRRQHSARREKCGLRTLLQRRQERACGSTRLISRGLRLRVTPVCGRARRCTPSCGAPFALRLRQPTCLGPHSSASAPGGPWQRQRRTFHIARPRTSFYGAAVLSPAAPSAAAAQRTAPAHPVGVRSALLPLRGGPAGAAVRAATQTPNGSRLAGRPCRAQRALRLRRQPRGGRFSAGPRGFGRGSGGGAGSGRNTFFTDESRAFATSRVGP